MILRPPQDQRIDEVVTVAPTYSGGQSLGAQSREIEEIQSLLATRRVSGKRSDFLSLVRNPPRGVIHFAGHGEIAGRSAVERRFAIRLEDGAFDVMDWRGVTGGQGRERALFFFNACDIGQAESVAGAVEGWAPAVLARGAAGYIGGLWPLKDDPAARFAVAFYRAVAKRLADDGEASVAGALSDARKLFYETADPTYLGYAFYGDAQLALVRR
jgi:CHAT domain-containing protein